MKIIAEAPGKFILEATKTEVANFIGYYYENASDCPRLHVGSEIRIAEMYFKLSQLQMQKNTVREASDSLRVLAGLLDPLDPVTRAIIESEEQLCPTAGTSSLTTT